MFFDTAQIQVTAGKGGDGAVAFRREKYVPFGGPSGGDGGHGGDVIFFVDPTVNTLVYFRHHHQFKAGHGDNGRGKNQTGADGSEMRIPVPPGTVVRDAKTDEVLGDLTEPKAELIVARGGAPGKGNARFATSTNQAPRMATNGLPGEERTARSGIEVDRRCGTGRPAECGQVHAVGLHHGRAAQDRRLSVHHACSRTSAWSISIARHRS